MSPLPLSFPSPRYVENLETDQPSRGQWRALPSGNRPPKLPNFSECFATLITVSLESEAGLCHAGNIKLQISIPGECVVLGSARYITIFTHQGLRAGNKERWRIDRFLPVCVRARVCACCFWPKRDSFRRLEKCISYFQSRKIGLFRRSCVRTQLRPCVLLCLL